MLLLVFDNCEHLIDAAAGWPKRCSRECSGVRILATSREGLGGGRRAIWPLRALALARSSRRPRRRWRATSVRLFVERAQAARPSFALDARQRRGGCRDLPASRRDPAGDRAGGGAGRRLEPRRDRAAARRAVPAADRRAAQPLWSATRRCAPPSTGRIRLLDRARARRCSTASACSPAPSISRLRPAWCRARKSKRGTSSTRSGAWSRSPCSSSDEATDGMTRYRLLETMRQYAARSTGRARRG